MPLTSGDTIGEEGLPATCVIGAVGDITRLEKGRMPRFGIAVNAPAEFVPRDDGLFKMNYFEQKNDQEFSLFLAPHPEEAQLISLDGRRRKGRKPSQGCPGFCRRAENYEKRPKLGPTIHIMSVGTAL